eukprot:COSAG06_NODE_421_length_15973_cov_18.743795_11_plen_447_part_00
MQGSGRAPAVAQVAPRPRGLGSPTSSRTFEVEKTENPLGKEKAAPSAPRASQMRGLPEPCIVQAVPAADAPEGCATAGALAEATVVDVEAPSPAPAPGALPRELAAEMAKHGLTDADQQQLFGEGIITVDRFKGLSDANYPTSIDVGARREAKRQRDQAAAQARHDQAVQAARERHTAACLEQVRQALAQAQLTESAPVAAILKRAPDVGALRRLAEDRGALEATGVGAHDRQQLQNFCCGAGLRLAAPVPEVVLPVERALTEPERQAGAERQAQQAAAEAAAEAARAAAAQAKAQAEAERKAAAVRRQRQQRYPAYLLLCGVAVQQCGWWSLYGDLGLWCGLVGGAAALAGAVGFDCAPGHDWDGPDRGWFWGCICLCACPNALATWASARAGCPTTGSWGDRYDQCEEHGVAGAVEAALTFASLSLPCLLVALCFMCKELGRMR